MSCYTPNQAFYSYFFHKSGKRKITYKREEAYCGGVGSNTFLLPCRQCVGCRVEYSRQWAMRCMHEASLHANNCFITLTYAPSFLPKGGTLFPRDFQLFMKRLRKKFGNGIRFFHCGEYGDKHGRPHYHAIIFGHAFTDLVQRTTSNGIPVYVSADLQKLWKKGYSSVGTVTYASAAYVARYCVKKIVGKDAKDHYERVDLDTGEIYYLVPEYATQSRKPGIASAWFKQYSSDVYPNDEVVFSGKVMSPPKYYDAQYELDFPEEYAIVKKARALKNAKKFICIERNDYSRLRANETYALLENKRRAPRNLFKESFDVIEDV